LKLVLVLLALLAPLPALAYVDPNAGGILLQLLAPVFAAIAGAWLFLRRWIADWFRRAWRRLTGRTNE
jgi:site-specific recombinase